MNSIPLSTTESHVVDLIALRAWHWAASCDPTRDHEMRTWHRKQTKYITMRLSAQNRGRVSTEVLAVTELCTESARELVQKEMREVCAGDWEANCRLAREAIVKRLKVHSPFEDLA